MVQTKAAARLSRRSGDRAAATERRCFTTEYELLCGNTKLTARDLVLEMCPADTEITAVAIRKSVVPKSSPGCCACHDGIERILRDLWAAVMMPTEKSEVVQQLVMADRMS